MRFITELKRRNVFRVGIAYLITAWLILQMTDVLSELLSLPEQVGPIVVGLISIGFPLALFFAWVFELTPDGVKRETKAEHNQSTTQQTGRKLNIAIMVLMGLAITYLLLDKFYLAQVSPAVPGASEITQADTQPAAASAQDSGEEGDPSPSIAVLPFENRSRLEDDVFFVQGVHDDLLTNLARISDLKVISRTTVTQYKDTDKTLPVIASELGVAYIMEGAVQRAGDTVRINVQLIRADSDEHVWAEIFDRKLTAANLFEIQSEISGKIAGVLQSTLTPQERARISDRPTDNLAAYNAYLRGRQALALYSSEGAGQALAEFRRAVELDPSYALAWASLAGSAMQGLFLSDMNRGETLEITREAATRAIELNDQLAEAHLARAALIGLEKGTWVPEYEQALLRAIELSPGLAEAWFNYARFLSGRNTRGDEALTAARRAAELDPLSTRIQSQLVTALSNVGRYEEAENRLQELIALNESFALNYVTMAELRHARGDYAGALWWRRLAQQKDPGNILFHLHESWVLTNLGLESQYQDFLDRIETLDPGSSTLAMAETFISMARGNLDAALEGAAAWLRAFPEDDLSRYFFRSMVYSFRNEPQKSVADMKRALGTEFELESLLGMARDAPERTCRVADAINRGSDSDMGVAMAKAAIEHVDHELMDHQVRELNLGVSLCHLVLDDTEGALQRLEQAVEDGQVDQWWLTMSHPLYDQFAFEPRYLRAREKIEEMMEEQRQRFLALSRESKI